MFNFEKLLNLAAEQGKSISYICSRLGVESSYFSDAENNEQEIPSDHIIIIADILNTTVEYLNDEEAKVVKEHLISFQNSHDEPWKSIANATGVEITQVANWCLGRAKVSEEHFQTLANLFNISVDILVGKINATNHEENLDKIAPQIWNAIEHDPQALRLINKMLQMSHEQRNELEKKMEEI